MNGKSFNINIRERKIPADHLEPTAALIATTEGFKEEAGGGYPVESIESIIDEVRSTVLTKGSNMQRV